MPEDPDVVVIGSGLAGLTVAAYLAANDQRVLVLEQYDVAGAAARPSVARTSGSLTSASITSGGVKTGETPAPQGIGLRTDRIPELDPDGFDTFVFRTSSSRCRRAGTTTSASWSRPSRGRGGSAGSHRRYAEPGWTNCVRSASPTATPTWRNTSRRPRPWSAGACAR